MGALAGSRLMRRRRPSTSRPPPSFLLGLVVGLALLAAIPLVYLLLRAASGGPEALDALLRQRTMELVLSTMALALSVAAGATVLGVPLGWLTTRTDLPARRAWAILTVAPLAIPSYLLAFSFVGALAPGGWLTSLLGPLGVGTLPGPYGFAGAWLVLTLATSPYVIIATRAAFARQDASTTEAARSLGEGPWAAARTAVLPVLMPAIGAGALLAALYAISDFGAVSILRMDTLATAVYSQYRFSFDRSSAAATATLLVLLALALVWAEAWVRRRSAVRAPHGRRRPPRTFRLAGWRYPAIAFCTAVTALSLGLPAVTVASWLRRAVDDAMPLGRALEALQGSLTLGVSAASLAALLALPVAWLVVHHPGRWTALSERLLYLLYAIPGISLALAVVSFTLQVAPAVYQSLLVLVLAVAMRYLVQAVGALRGPLLQISPRTLEAARSLGERPMGAVRSVTLPLLRPGLVAGLALVFLSALKELPLTLLLAPTGFQTLATRLWDAARDAHYGDAAVPALLLLVVSGVSVGLLYRHGDVRA
jgi:iron(III) transport system permease protein